MFCKANLILFDISKDTVKSFSRFLGFALFSLFFASAVLADDDLYQVHKCDILAAASYDNDSIVKPVTQLEIVGNYEEVISVCEKAVQDYPENNRFKFQLARALFDARIPLMTKLHHERYKEIKVKIASLAKSALEGGYLPSLVILGKLEPSASKEANENAVRYYQEFLSKVGPSGYVLALLASVKSKRLGLLGKDFIAEGEDLELYKAQIRKEVISDLMKALRNGYNGALVELSRIYYTDKGYKSRSDTLLNIAIALGDPRAKFGRISRLLHRNFPSTYRDVLLAQQTLMDLKDFEWKPSWDSAEARISTAVNKQESAIYIPQAMRDIKRYEESLNGLLPDRILEGIQVKDIME